MEPKYQTKAKRAEEHIYSELLQEKSLLKPWSLVTRNVEVRIRTLQTTADEVGIVFVNPNYLRPGYEAESSSVEIPCLFIKVSGEDDAFAIFNDTNYLTSRESCFTYASIASFHNNAVSPDVFEDFLSPGGLVEREKLTNSGKQNFLLLRREYQKLYLDAIDNILMHKEEYFKGIASDISQKEILSSLLQLDANILHAYNATDFQFQPPSIIINNADKEQFQPKQAACLLFLHLLGFDVIITTKSAAADIENVLNGELYTVFYGEKRSAAKNKPVLIKNISKKAVVIAAVFFLAITGFILSKYFVRPNTAVASDISSAAGNTEAAPTPDRSTEQASQTPIQSSANTEQASETPTQSNGNTEQASQTPTQSTPIDYSAILSDNKLVTKMLNIKTGETINLSDIDPSMKGSVAITGSEFLWDASYKEKDAILLGSITADKNLEYGEEATVSFEYTYNVTSCEQAAILIGFNYNGYDAFTDKVVWAVPKGYGVLTFTIPVTPKKWVETPFIVSAGMISIAGYNPLPAGYRVSILPSDPGRVTVR